jgi:hypothetical protein
MGPRPAGFCSLMAIAVFALWASSDLQGAVPAPNENPCMRRLTEPAADKGRTQVLPLSFVVRMRIFRV